MAFDHDGDGSITYDQLLELMKYLGYDTDSSAAFGILEDIDVNGEGYFIPSWDKWIELTILL